MVSDRVRPLLPRDVPDAPVRPFRVLGRVSTAPLPARAGSVFRVRLDAQDGVQFLGREAQQVLQVAHEAVHVALP